VDEAQYRALPAAIASARAYRALALGDIPGTLAHARRALALAAEDDGIRRSQAAGLSGIAELAGGDLAAAERSLLAFQAAARQRGDIANALGITFILASIWLAQGRLREAVSAYQEALHHAEHQTALPIGASDLYRGFSELLCEQGDLESAAQYLKTAQHVGEQAALTGWPHRRSVAQARLLAAHGDLSSALSLLEEAERQYVRNPLPDQPIAAMKARLWVRQEQLSAASAWAREQNLSPADDLDYLHEFEHLTLARVLIARYRDGRDEGSLRDARRLLDRLQQSAEAGGRAGSVIEILMLQALARHAQGDTPAAIISLERALTLAEPEGYVRLFVDEGEPMRLLIADCGREYSARLRIENRANREGGRLIGYTARLLAAFGQPAVAPQSKIRNPQSAIPEPLSERELDVLKLLGTELSGPEIADRLSVSLNTVRTHTKNIYSKLGVNSRRTAVRRAEEVGLL
jgi:LuxR family maltose regulon positive regulatory protein